MSFMGGYIFGLLTSVWAPKLDLVIISFSILGFSTGCGSIQICVSTQLCLNKNTSILITKQQSEPTTKFSQEFIGEFCFKKYRFFLKNILIIQNNECRGAKNDKYKRNNPEEKMIGTPYATSVDSIFPSFNY